MTDNKHITKKVRKFGMKEYLFKITPKTLNYATEKIKFEYESKLKSGWCVVHPLHFSLLKPPIIFEDGTTYYDRAMLLGTFRAIFVGKKRAKEMNYKIRSDAYDN